MATVKCPVCSSTELYSEPYVTRPDAVSSTAIAYFGSREKKRCEDCGTGFAYPYFGESELGAFYAKAYWQEREGVPARLDFTRAKEHYVFLFNALDDSRSIVDFGCGRGEFSLFMRQLYPDKDLRAVDKSHYSKPQLEQNGISFQDDLSNCTGLDLLYSSHSLEHVADLNATMEQFMAVTSERAFLFFEVPNVAGPYVFQACAHVPHTYMFNLRSFETLSARYGLDILGTHICGMTWAEKLRQQHPEAMATRGHLRVLMRKRATR